MTEMTEVLAESPAVGRWRQRFAADASEALGAALSGRVSLGPYDRARPADALTQILAEPDFPRADGGIAGWLEGLIGGPVPEGLSGKRFAEALVEVFRLIALLRLRAARAWCAEHHAELRAWLRSFYFGRSRDPEAALLVALAHEQRDRALHPLWLAIVRHGKPIEHVRHALLGLRLMPADDQGAVERGLPKALLRGLLEFGEALARSGDHKGNAWLSEIDFLAAVYPMSNEQWGCRFRELLQARQVAPPVQNWLDQRYPAGLKRHAKDNLHPPHLDDLKALLQQVATNYDNVRPRLQRLVDEHRHYCRESGDSYYLVRAFCNAGNRLLERDPTWARDLAHEAALWAPQNPYAWALLARALEAEGDWRRAEAVYWHARRRFPHNAHSHTHLAHALVVHRAFDVGEAVYREAIRLFPDNPYCWIDLAHTLRVSGRREEAVRAYRKAQAQELFHRNVVLATALANTLIDLNWLDEARAALDWAQEVAPRDDKRAQAKIAQARARFDQSSADQPVALEPTKSPPERPGGSFSAFADITGADFSQAPQLGRGGLFRRKGNGGLERAWAEVTSLRDGAEKLIETGLWHAAKEGWSAAAQWFDGSWTCYEGDGVLRVHRQRARARAGQIVDWASERNQYPELLPVILAEERGAPPHLNLNPDDQDLTEEQRQDLWFASLFAGNDATLTDLAEEHFLAARQLV